MKKTIKKLFRLVQIPFVLVDFFKFKKVHDGRFSLSLSDAYPCLKDKTMRTGFDRHYVYFTAWAARILAETKPSKHTDISSSLYFAGMASAFVPIDFYDYRPADLVLSNLKAEPGDITALPFTNDSIESLSSMHVIEHIGLGRYGDPMDPIGDVKGAKELARVLKSGGQLLFVTPVGKENKIEYNAHRIYTYHEVMRLFPTLTLKEFSLISEDEVNGGLIRYADPSLINKENYACGCFLFTK